VKIVKTSNAPAAIGPYAQAVIVGNLVYTSGQIPLCPKTMELVDGGIAKQTEQVMANLETVLAAAGSSPTNVVKATCFLSDLANFDAFNAVYAKTFTQKPARSCVEAKLPKGALVEVEVIAELKDVI